MPIFTIFDADDNILKRFSPDDDALGDSVSVGRSGKCAVSLAEFGDVVGAVEDIHFAIVREGARWRLKNPGNELRTPAGRKIVDVEVSDGLEVLFGDCRMVARCAGDSGEYDLAWRNAEGGTERAPLFPGRNVVGSAAVCDVVIGLPAVPPECATITCSGKVFYVDPVLSGERGQNKASFKSFAVAANRVFNIGGVSVKIVSRDIPDSEVSFSESSLNWKLVNFLLGIILIGLLAALAFNAIRKGDIGKSTGMPGGKPALLADIKKNVEAGDAEKALAALSRFGNLLRDDARKELKNALTLEFLAMRSLYSYSAKADNDTLETLEVPYMRFVCSPEGNTLPIKTNIEYWNDALVKIAADKEKITRDAQPVLAKFGISSGFLARYSKTREKIKQLIETYKESLQVSNDWRTRRWNELASLLRADLKGSKLNYNKATIAYVEEIVRIADFAGALDAAREEFARSSFHSYDYAKADDQLKAFTKTVGTFKKDFPPQYRQFDSEIKEFKKDVDNLRALKAALARWRKNMESLEAFSKLAKILLDCGNSDSKAAIVHKAVKSVRTEIDRFIVESVDEIKAEPDKTLLAKCDNLANFIVAMGDYSSEIASKLRRLRGSIERKIQHKCDILYEVFLEARSHGDLDAMRRALNNVVATAPDGSKYHTWASRELKRL